MAIKIESKYVLHSAILCDADLVEAFFVRFIKFFCAIEFGSGVSLKKSGAAMYKIILFSSLCFWLTACGNDQVALLQEQRAFKELNPSHENAIITKKENNSKEKKTAFTKCSLKNIPQIMIAYNNLQQLDPKINMLTNLIITEGSFNWSKSFTEEYTSIDFEQSSPCDQLQISFSSELSFNTQIYNLINENEIIKAMENKANIDKVKIYKSFMLISGSNTADNINVLPDHLFRISVDCESDLEFACGNSWDPSGKCDSISNLKGKIPDGTCKIKGSNQIFALYPTGHVRINFEGSLKKIGERTDGTSKLELVFNQVEWR